MQVKDELGLTDEATATVTFLNIIIPCGDVNSDGSIDIVDALMTAQFYVGLEPHSFDESAADVNGDGLIDIIDALLIAQYYVGLIETLPCYGQINLAGIIIHNKTPMSNITSIEPSFWFRDESTGQAISGVITDYDTSSGAYAFSNLPDTKIGIDITYHLAGSTGTLPGNYTGWEVVDLSELTPGEIELNNLYVEEIIHLLEPYDNDQKTLTTGPPYPAHSSPITFSWASVNGTDHYEVNIGEYNDPPSYSRIQSIASENLTGTDYTIVLPASASETHYEVSIYAYNSADVLIGQYMTTYTNGHGWDYRFIIRDYPKIIIFDAGGKSGALDGRTGADLLCTNYAGSQPELAGKSVRALISVSSTDEIRDMPSRYGVPTDLPIVSLTGKKIADNWADLLDGTIDMTLSDAGILTYQFWYSGSNTNGSLHTCNCTGWTSPSGYLDGRFGKWDFTDDSWISHGDATCGLDIYHILGIAWN